jgi:hypothetical protein
MVHDAGSKAALWQCRLDQCRRSGLSQAEFCRRKRIPISTFGWWKRRLAQGGPGARSGTSRPTSSKGNASFVPVRLVESGSAARHVEVEVEWQRVNGQTWRIRCDAFDAEVLQQILRVLQTGLRSC